MKILEANGANIPALGLGTWLLNDDVCTNIVSAALKGGYTHIDTAVKYGNEEAVGAGLRDSGLAREDYFLTTKIWPTEFSQGTYQRGVEESLKRLDVDYVDLLLIHWPPQMGNVQEWTRMTNEMAERGLAKHLGVANFTVPQLDAIVDVSDRPIVCNQVENHPYINQAKVHAACQKHGVAMISYCPLFRGGDLFDEPAVKNAAEAHDKTLAQIVLRWHVQQEGVGAIPKTATPSRLPENLNIFDFELTADEVNAIDALMVRQERICDFEFSPKWDSV